VNTRITEDSERLCQDGIEQVHKVHRNPEPLNVLWEKRLRQEGVERVRRQHREKELLEFCHLKEASIEGTFMGLLNTQKDSARRLLEQGARKALIFSI
jgi:hypothetical protein